MFKIGDRVQIVKPLAEGNIFCISQGSVGEIVEVYKKHTPQCKQVVRIEFNDSTHLFYASDVVKVDQTTRDEYGRDGHGLIRDDFDRTFAEQDEDLAVMLSMVILLIVLGLLIYHGIISK